MKFFLLRHGQRKHAFDDPRLNLFFTLMYKSSTHLLWYMVNGCSLDFWASVKCFFLDIDNYIQMLDLIVNHTNIGNQKYFIHVYLTSNNCDHRHYFQTFIEVRNPSGVSADMQFVWFTDSANSMHHLHVLTW